jgi:hypothetical protein
MGYRWRPTLCRLGTLKSQAWRPSTTAEWNYLVIKNLAVKLLFHGWWKRTSFVGLVTSWRGRMRLLCFGMGQRR